MKFARKNEIYQSDEILFYADIKRRALLDGTDANMTRDQFIEGELREKWTTESPELVLAWEKHQALRQESAKKYSALEEETIKNL